MFLVLFRIIINTILIKFLNLPEELNERFKTIFPKIQLTMLKTLTRPAKSNMSNTYYREKHALENVKLHFPQVTTLDLNRYLN